MSMSTSSLPKDFIVSVLISTDDVAGLLWNRFQEMVRLSQEFSDYIPAAFFDYCIEAFQEHASPELVDEAYEQIDAEAPPFYLHKFISLYEVKPIVKVHDGSILVDCVCSLIRRW